MKSSNTGWRDPTVGRTSFKDLVYLSKGEGDELALECLTSSTTSRRRKPFSKSTVNNQASQRTLEFSPPPHSFHPHLLSLLIQPFCTCLNPRATICVVTHRSTLYFTDFSWIMSTSTYIGEWDMRALPQWHQNSKAVLLIQWQRNIVSKWLSLKIRKTGVCELPRM